MPVPDVAHTDLKRREVSLGGPPRRRAWVRLAACFNRAPARVKPFGLVALDHTNPKREG